MNFLEFKVSHVAQKKFKLHAEVKNAIWAIFETGRALLMQPSRISKIWCR
jgi:hypothetical protein